MTEKRFNIHEQMSTILGYECVFDNQKEEWLSIRDTVLCLTELAEENEQLKQKIVSLKVELDTHKHPLWSTREAERIVNELKQENEQLKQSIKEIDDAELHLKQIILKRIDDYIWEWDDEGTPVAQVLKELKEDIMTEKRFNFIKDTVAENLKTPISDGNNILSIGEVLDEMNKLNDENEQLKSRITTLKGGYDEYEEIVGELKAENEELKLQNKQYSMMVNVNSDLNDEIYMQLQKTEKNYKSVLEENEQLKQEKKDIVITDARDYNELYDDYKELEEENKQLKKLCRKYEDKLIELGEIE